MGQQESHVNHGGQAPPTSELQPAVQKSQSQGIWTVKYVIRHNLKYGIFFVENSIIY